MNVGYVQTQRSIGIESNSHGFRRPVLCAVDCCAVDCVTAEDPFCNQERNGRRKPGAKFFKILRRIGWRAVTP